MDNNWVSDITNHVHELSCSKTQIHHRQWQKVRTHTQNGCRKYVANICYTVFDSIVYTWGTAMLHLLVLCGEKYSEDTGTEFSLSCPRAVVSLFSLNVTMNCCGLENRKWFYLLDMGSTMDSMEE